MYLYVFEYLYEEKLRVLLWEQRKRFNLDIGTEEDEERNSASLSLIFAKWKTTHVH